MSTAATSPQMVCSKSLRDRFSPLRNALARLIAGLSLESTSMVSQPSGVHKGRKGVLIGEMLARKELSVQNWGRKMTFR